MRHDMQNVGCVVHKPIKMKRDCFWHPSTLKDQQIIIYSLCRSACMQPACTRAIQMKPEKNMESAVLHSKPSAMTLIFRAVPHHVPHISASFPLRHKFLGTPFGCCASQSCTASYDLKWRPPRSSFMGQKRWKLLGAQSGAYDGRCSTANFKSWICWTVCRALSCCRHPPEDNQPRRFLRIAGLSWFWNLFLFVSCYEFYTVFRLSFEWALCCGTQVVVIALYRGKATAVIHLTLWLLVGWAAPEHNTKLPLLFRAATDTAVRHRASVIHSTVKPA